MSDNPHTSAPGPADPDRPSPRSRRGRGHDEDPLDRLERTIIRSGTRAYWYAGSVVVATVVSAVVVAVAGAAAGGPNCDAGWSSFICSRTWEIVFPLVPSLISLIGALGAFWKCYDTWRRFERWRPWIAMIWVLLPWTLIWMTATLPILMLGVAP